MATVALAEYAGAGLPHLGRVSGYCLQVQGLLVATMALAGCAGARLPFLGRAREGSGSSHCDSGFS